MGKMMGLREYARHREASGLPGTTLRAVQKAVESGRISTIPDAKGKTKIDPAVADIQWSNNTDPDQSARANAGRRITLGGTGHSESNEQNAYWDARTRREIAEASKAELELEEMAGNLVDKDGTRRAAFEVGRVLRDMILAVPTKLAGELSALSDTRAIEARMREELRKPLDQMARLAKVGLPTQEQN